MTALHLTRPFAPDDFRAMRAWQVEGADLVELSYLTERTQAEVNVALDMKLGRTPEDAAAMVNARFAVWPAAPSPLARFIDGLFGRGGRT